MAAGWQMQCWRSVTGPLPYGVWPEHGISKKELINVNQRGANGEGRAGHRGPPERPEP